MPLEFSRVTLPPLLSVDEARVHLHLTGPAYDADVQQKLTAAQEAICSYLNTCADPEWTADTAPLAVKHAILLLTASWYEDREAGGSQDPWPAIYHLLAGYRDPTVK